MKIDLGKFRVAAREKVKLKKWPTLVKPIYASDEQYRERLAEHVAQLSERQNLLYASNSHALLLIFQAMDAAGKDGAIKHVMSGINPQGCQVFSFKHPSAEELDHDFLWRTTRSLPERGRIGIFNRSYYEEVLIARVHPEILRAEGLPATLLDGESIWQQRYRSITGLENHLHRNGTRIVKFFLHIDKDEQKARLQARLSDPTRNWKFSTGDLPERALWDQYIEAFEECLERTSTAAAPWYLVPANRKWFRNLAVSRIVEETFERLDPRYPPPAPGLDKVVIG